MSTKKPFVITESMLQWIYKGKPHVLVAGDPLWFTAALGLLLDDDKLLNDVEEKTPVDLPIHDGPWTIVHKHETGTEKLESAIGQQALELLIRILFSKKTNEHVEMYNVHGVTLYSTSPHNG